MSAEPVAGRRPSELDGFLEAVPDATVVADESGVIQAVNAQAEQLFGYPRSEMVGQQVEILVPTALRDSHLLHRSDHQRDPQARTFEESPTVRARHRDGHEFEVEISLAPLETEQGLLTSASVRPVAPLRPEERLFRGLLEAAPDAMVIVDHTGTIVLVNAQVEANFGYRRAELIGRSVEVLVPDRFAGAHAGFRSRYTDRPATRPMSGATELFARRKDGSEFPVEISLAPLETEDGLLISAAVRDISERRRMQEEADRIKDEFFATVSHELRTPLTSILGYSELMVDLETLSPQGHRFMSMIARSAERELRLVDDLLTLVAIEEAGLAIRPELIDLQRVVQDSVDAARPVADEVDVELVLVSAGIPVPIDADADRIGQALDNLLSNAFKFTPPGGRVQVTLSVADKEARIEIADTGPGIGTQEQIRIFERLYRSGTAIANQVPGAGLGLTITLAIVEAHRGSISVLKSDQDGTTFLLTLPLEA